MPKKSYNARSINNYEENEDVNIGATLTVAGGVAVAGELTTTRAVNDVNVAASNPIAITAAQAALGIVQLNTPSGSVGVFRSITLPDPSTMLPYLASDALNTVYEIRIIVNFSTALNTGWPVYFESGSGNTIVTGKGTNTTNVLRENFIIKKMPAFVRMLCRLTSPTTATCYLDSAHVTDPYAMPGGLTLFQQSTISTTFVYSANDTAVLTPQIIINRVVTFATTSDSALTIVVQLPSAADLVNAVAPPNFYTIIAAGSVRASGSGSVTNNFNLTPGSGVQSAATSGPPVFTASNQFTTVPTSTSVVQTRRMIFFSASSDGAQWRYMMCNA